MKIQQTNSKEPGPPQPHDETEGPLPPKPDDQTGGPLPPKPHDETEGPLPPKPNDQTGGPLPPKPDDQTTEYPVCCQPDDHTSSPEVNIAMVNNEITVCRILYNTMFVQIVLL